MKHRHMVAALAVCSIFALLLGTGCERDGGGFGGVVTGSYTGKCSNKHASGPTMGDYALNVNPGGTFQMTFLDPSGSPWITVDGTWKSANNTYAMMDGSGKNSTVGTLTVKGTITRDAGKLGASGTFKSTGGAFGTACSGTYR